MKQLEQMKLSWLDYEIGLDEQLYWDFRGLKTPTVKGLLKALATIERHNRSWHGSCLQARKSSSLGDGVSSVEDSMKSRKA